MAAKDKSTVAGVEADLALLPAEIAGSGLARTALALARELDADDAPAQAKAGCARALLAVMREVRGLAVPDEVDELDELTERRRARG